MLDRYWQKSRQSFLVVWSTSGGKSFQSCSRNSASLASLSLHVRLSRLQAFNVLAYSLIPNAVIIPYANVLLSSTKSLSSCCVVRMLPLHSFLLLVPSGLLALGYDALLLCSHKPGVERQVGGLECQLGRLCFAARSQASTSLRCMSPRTACHCLSASFLPAHSVARGVGRGMPPPSSRFAQWGCGCFLGPPSAQARPSRFNARFALKPLAECFTLRSWRAMWTRVHHFSCLDCIACYACLHLYAHLY